MSAKKEAVWDGAFYIVTSTTGKSSDTSTKIFKYLPGDSLVEDADKMDKPVHGQTRGGFTCFSGDGQYLALINNLTDNNYNSGSGDYTIMYKWEGSKWAHDAYNIGFTDGDIGGSTKGMLLNDDGSMLLHCGPSQINAAVGAVNTLSRTGSAWTQDSECVTGFYNPSTQSVSAVYSVCTLSNDFSTFVISMQICDAYGCGGAYNDGHFILERNGTKLDLLTEITDGSARHNMVTSTADGSRFCMGDGSGVFFDGFHVYSWDGVNAVKLPFPTGYDDNLSFVFMSPDGTQVAAVANTSLFIFTWDGSKYIYGGVIATDPDMSGYRENTLKWSSDSQHIVYLTKAYPHVFTLDRTGNSWSAGVSATYQVEPQYEPDRFSMTKGLPS